MDSPLITRINDTKTEHADLLKMDDKRLEKELIYANQHIQACISNIEYARFNFKHKLPLAVPIAYLLTDLNLAVERYTAICEEIHFRIDQMR